MTNETELACVIYGSDIHPQEEAALKSMESAIIDTLLDHKITPRPMWTESTNPGPRALQLYAFAEMKPRVLAELMVDKIGSLSKEELITLIKKTISED